MAYEMTEAETKEMDQIGQLYRSTIYDSSLKNLPSMVKAFYDGLKGIGGDISTSISGEVLRVYKLISSHYTGQFRELIDGLHSALVSSLPGLEFSIVCRQKSWESILRKVLKYYLSKNSIMLYDLIALRIIIDSDAVEKEQEEMCYSVTKTCILHLTKGGCVLMSPSKQVANNSLLKDYISNPKENGYKSIHLAFMDLDNNLFEVQIRTQTMDANAEFGLQQNDGLNHDGYKRVEYENLIDYIYFDPSKVNKPFFRFYKKPDNSTVIVDKIGLKFAKPIEERARTF